MTDIGGVSVQAPAAYTLGGYDVTMLCKQASELLLDTMRELFSLCDTTNIQWVPGRRPIGWDPTEDSVNTVYVTWTHGNKPENGYYLLRSFNLVEDESAFGHAQGFRCGLTFLGTLAYLTLALDCVDLDEVTNDWGL